MALNLIHDRDDVEDDEWGCPSECPVSGPGSEVRAARAVRPVVYLYFDCETAWTRVLFESVGYSETEGD